MEVTEKSEAISKTLEHGLRLLLCFLNHKGELSLTEISQSMGRNVSSTYRLVLTLEQNGFLKKNPENRKYSLGAVLRQLGESADDKAELIALAHPYLKKLHEEFNENVNLYIYQNYKCQCIDRIESSQSVRANYPVGHVRSLLRGAAGKAIFAWLSPKIRSTVVHMETEAPPDEAELIRIRDRGYAVSHDETGHGTSGVAAPVFDQSSRLVAVVNLSAPCYRMPPEVVEKCVGAVQKAAKEISAELAQVNSSGL